MSIPYHRSNDDNTLFTVQELEFLFHDKSKEIRERILGERFVVTSTGFVDTHFGEVLKNNEVMKATAEKATRDAAR